MTLTALQVLSTEDESVQICCTYDKLPVNIYIERAAIDAYLRITNSDAQYKRDFIKQNLDALKLISETRFKKGLYEKENSNGTDVISIALTLADLMPLSLIKPRRRLG